MSQTADSQLQQRVAGHMTCTEEVFDSTLPNMEIQELVDTVSVLQAEMAQEQQRFESLSAELSTLNPDTQPEKHASVSARMVQSQSRLATLVGRNMKCFTQQAANENTALLAELGTSEPQSGATTNYGTRNSTDGHDSHTTDLQNRNTQVASSQNVLSKASVPENNRKNATEIVSNTSLQLKKQSISSTPPWKMVKSNQDPTTSSKEPMKSVQINMATQEKVPVKSSFVIRSGAKDNSVGNLENSRPNSVTENGDGEANDSINFSAARTLFESSTLPKDGRKKKNFEIPKRSMSNAGSYTKTLNTSNGANISSKMSKSISAQELGSARDQTDGLSSGHVTTKPQTSSISVNLVTKNPPTPKASGPPRTARSSSVHSQQADWTDDFAGPRYSSYDAAGSIRKKPALSSNTSTNFHTLRSISEHSSLSTHGQSHSQSRTEERSQQPSNTSSTVRTAASSSSQPTRINHALSVDPPAPFTNLQNGNLSNQEPVTPRPAVTVETKKQDPVVPKPVVTMETRVVHEVPPAPKPVAVLEPQRENTQVVPPKQKQAAPPAPQAPAIRPSVEQLTNGHAALQQVGGAKSVGGAKMQAVVAAPALEKPGSLVTPPIVQTDKEGFTTDELVKQRTTLKDWDPTLLLKDLYEVKLHPDTEQHSQYINMEGYMEKLPTNKKKATLLKTWKRRYFKAINGMLYYFESRQDAQDTVLSTVELYVEETGGGEKASASFQLMGGSLEDLGGRTIGIDDGRGRYLVVRCPSDKEFSEWKLALESQMGGNIKATYIKPALVSQPSSRRKAVIIDIGSCSVRAGLLGEKSTLPSVFFPTIVATDPSGTRRFGFDAYKPSVRASSNVSYPVRPSIRIDKSIDMEVMADMFKKVFEELGVNPKQHWVMLSSPANLSDKLKEQYMDILIKQFDVLGVNIANQTLLAMYSYNAKSGIMVDIGDRLEIVPITDGYVVEGGVTKQVYGGHRVGEAFNIALTERKYPFFADIEYQIVRLAMEKMCFVSGNHEEDVSKWNKDRSYCQDTLSLDKYDLPEGFVREITIDLGRFNAPEGLFNTEVWGMDNPPLPKLVQKAVQASPLDTRREMWRSIYLSGGATMLPGFTERLQAELVKLVPSSIVVEVHASPQRYHAAYIGASTLAGLPQFEQSCISADEWRKQGPKVLRKWHMY